MLREALVGKGSFSYKIGGVVLHAKLISMTTAWCKMGVESII